MGGCVTLFFRVLPLWAQNSGGPAELVWGDVTFDHPSHPSILKVLSATNSRRARTSSWDGPTMPSVRCQHARRISTLEVPNLDTYFRTEGKLSLKPRFIAEMKKALATIGLHKEDYTGRIGAATTAASVGMEDSTIQLLGIGGPWNSAAFLAYILGHRGPNWPR